MTISYLLQRLSERIDLYRIRRKVSSQIKSVSAPQFFILSSGRSGSTLLRKLLVEKYEVYIPPESNDLIVQSAKLFFRGRSNWVNSVNEFIELIKIMKLPAHWEINLDELQKSLLSIPVDQREFYPVMDLLYRSSAPDGLEYSIIGDKTPYLILRSDWLQALFPEAKYIYVMRDGRDVVLSRMKAFNESIEEAANRWLWAIKEYEKLKRKSRNVYLVKYEDLVSNTEQTLLEITKFLEVSPGDHSNLVALGDDKLKHHSNLSKPITIESIGKWRQDLSIQNQQRLNKKLLKPLLSYGYGSQDYK